MATRHQRRTENQKLFRHANERLEERVEELSPDGVPIPFLCECADEECFGRVDLTSEQYRKVRAASDHYVIVPGHPTVKGESVLEDNGHFQIVRKGE